MVSFVSCTLVCIHGLVVQKLYNIYATDGSVVGFDCSGYVTQNLFGIKIDNKVQLCTTNGGLPKGVLCQSSDNGGTQSNKVVTLNITIPATTANNDTTVTCYFHDYDLNYAETKATLYVTASKFAIAKIIVYIARQLFYLTEWNGTNVSLHDILYR